jgi:uncharacterized membrane protein YidH (DUF202 family)
MNAAKVGALVLIVGGILALVYGSFTYTKETHQANLGPVELSIKDKQTVNIPVWAGVGAIVIGGALLLLGGKRS